MKVNFQLETLLFFFKTRDMIKQRENTLINIANEEFLLNDKNTI